MFTILSVQKVMRS